MNESKVRELKLSLKKVRGSVLHFSLLFFARFLVELEVAVMLVVVWLCHDVGCSLVVP